MPSARMNQAGRFTVNYSNFDPYQRVSVNASPFDWLEAIFQYTDISTRDYSNFFEFSRNQTLKDKGFDVKLRLRKEGNIMPQISAGIRDLGGTGQFSSEYLVFSKGYKNIDFSAGIGWGYLSDNQIANPLKTISNKFLTRENDIGLGGEFSTSSYFRGKQSGVFAGLEYFFPFAHGLRLKIEYDSTDYSSEARNSLNQSSKYNFGLTYPLTKFLQISISNFRDNITSFGLSFSFDLSDKNYLVKKKKFKKEIKNQSVLKKVNSMDERYLYLSTLKYLNEEKLSVRTVNIDDKKLSVSFSQNKFISYPTSYGRAFEILDMISPDNIKRFELIPVNLGNEMLSVQVDRASYKAYKKYDFSEVMHKNIYFSEVNDVTYDHEYKPKTNYPYNFYSIGPSLKTHIGGPERFLIGGIDLRADTETLLSKNFNVQTISQYSLSNTYDVIRMDANSLLPQVRTNVSEYLKQSDDFSITRIQANYLNKFGTNLYSKISVGLFEEMFGGFGAEILFRPLHRNFALGAEIFRVRQRDYDGMFKFQDYKTTTGHINFFLHHPPSNILFKLSGGKYLAGDSGFTFDVSRRFASGAKMGVFFSLTDISDEEFGEGSFDKGFYVDIPLQSFLSNHSRTLSTVGLRPVTRDGAAKLIYGHDLYGITDQASLYNISINRGSYFD